MLEVILRNFHMSFCVALLQLSLKQFLEAGKSGNCTCGNMLAIYLCAYRWL